jgi:hypothetical protein
MSRNAAMQFDMHNNFSHIYIVGELLTF